MLKFPYGISDFYKLITEGYVYIDRTAWIPQLEDAGSHLVCLRPRRFGKSLLLSMLENYYDVAKADKFANVFGSLAISKNPTPKHHQYFVLKWDFSTVDPSGEPEEIKQALYHCLNGRIENFAARYQPYLSRSIQIAPTDALASFQSLLTAVQQTPYQLYLLIDEYDNFANEMMMGRKNLDQSRYKALLSGEGSLKVLFKAIKAASSGQGLDRVFITGVSPVVLSDLTSGYNIAKNLSPASTFNAVCGFSESEVRDLLTQVGKERAFPAAKVSEALTMMRTFYNGYCFGVGAEAGELLYNPTLTFYFMEVFQREGQYPRQMLDSNLTLDRGKLAYVARLPYGAQVIPAALDEAQPLSIEELADSFGVEQLMHPEKSLMFVASLLYYLGILTLGGVTPLGKLRLKIPNVVVRKLYVEQIQQMLLPDFDKGEAQQAAETFYSTGDLQPICDFIERRYFKVFDNRDYRWTNELTVKTVFLTLLFNDLWYLMDSEPALQREYADLVMILRPDMRQYQLLDLLLEFKDVSLQEVNLSGEQVRQLSSDEIKAFAPVQQKFVASQTKLSGYREILEAAYGERLRLHSYTVVAVGFDRLVWEEVR